MADRQPPARRAGATRTVGAFLPKLTQKAVERFDLITNPLTAGHVKLRYALRALPAWGVSAIEGGTRRLPYGLRSRLSVHAVTVLRKQAVGTGAA